MNWLTWAPYTRLFCRGLSPKYRDYTGNSSGDESDTFLLMMKFIEVFGVHVESNRWDEI